MSSVHADPAELRRFAATLKRFCDELRSSTSSLRGSMSHLGESWRDHEHRKFEQKFQATQRPLGQFVKEAEEYVRLLHKKAEILDRANGVRF